MHCLRFLACFALVLVALSGCSSPPTKLDDPTANATTQFNQLSGAYMQAYQIKRKPLSAEDLKAHLKANGRDTSLLISPRDNQPIVIVPLTPNLQVPEGERPILAYEQTGLDGKRLTVDVRGLVKLVPDEEFAHIKFAGGHKPKSQ